MQETSSIWMVIINPNAGKGKGLKDWPLISSMLMKYGIEFHHFITEKPMQAISVVAEFIENGYRKFIVTGGDGSLNEVVNGIFQQKSICYSEITLGHIPVGNGNDWGKTYANPLGYEESIKLICEPTFFCQDIGKITYQSDVGEKQRYFLNIAGFGFDALVVKDVDEAKKSGKSGKLIYFLTLLMDLFKSKYIEAKLKVDEHLIDKKFLSIAAGICKYNGGGMMILPFANPANGLLDVTMILDLSKIGVMRNVLYLFSGTFVRNKKVLLARGKSVQIDSEIPFLVEVDGEFLGKSPAKLEIIPSCLNVIVNSTNFEVNQKLKNYAP